MKNLIWHYTTEIHSLKIINDGILKPSYGEKAMGVKPALWFSKNPDWEPTATKLAADSEGNIIELSKEQHLKLFGMIRFGIEFDETFLISWIKYKFKSKIDGRIYNRLDKLGKMQGANPKDWYASFQGVASNKWVTIEEFDGESWKQIISPKQRNQMHRSLGIKTV
jgi:hypothetical protein